MDAKKYKVMIVDDSKFSTRVISEIIQTEDGLEMVAELNSSNEALQYTESNKYDIAIIDVVMPEMSGIELAQKISNLAPRVQIIMISSLTGERIVIDAISAGAVDYIQKPFSKETLLSAIYKSIENDTRL